MAYNPHTQYRGDVYLHRGITGGLDSIAEAIESKSREKKDRARKFKGLAEYADAAGIVAKDESTVMSLDELEGRVRAEEYKRLKAESDLRQQAFQAQIGSATMQQQQGQRMRQFGSELAAYSSAPSAGGTLANALASPDSGVTLSELSQYAGANPVPNRVMPQDVMEIAGRSGVLSPDMAADLVQMGQPRPQANEFPVSALGQPTGPAVNGMQFIPTSTGGGQLLPIDQASGAGTALPTVPGYTPVPTGRGGVQWLPESKDVTAARSTAARRLQTLRTQEAKLSSKVSAGDNSVGPEFLGLGDRSAKLTAVQSEIAAIQTQFPDLAPQAAQSAAAGSEAPKFGNFNEGAVVKDKSGRMFRIVNGKPVPL